MNRKKEEREEMQRKGRPPEGLGELHGLLV
jgi:hypothetical protein